MMTDNRTTAQALAGLFDTDMLMSDEFSRREKEPALLQAPRSLVDQMDERHGKFKSRLGLFGHLLGGGTVDNFGDADLVSQYTADKQAYDTQRKIQGFQQMMPFINEQIGFMQDDDLTNNAAAMFALGQVGVDKNMAEMMFPSIAKASSELPDATRAVIHYQDSLNTRIDGEGNPYILPENHKDYVKYSDAYDRYKKQAPDVVRDLSQAAAEGTAAGQNAQEIINKAPAEAATMNSAMSTIESLGQISKDAQTGEAVFTPHNAEEFNDVYGTLDRFKPFGFSEEETFIRETVEKIQSILAVDARGKLKGQGQISDKETAMLERSLSILNSRGISPKRAREEIARIYSVMEKGFAQKQEIMNPPSGGSGATDFDSLWYGTQP